MDGSIYGIINRKGKMHLTENCLDVHDLRQSDNHVSYVEVVLFPLNGKWWLSPKEYPEEWEFSYSTYCAPGWFQKKKYEEEYRKKACHCWKRHVLYRKDIARLSHGDFLVKDCHIGEISGNTHFLCCDSYVQLITDNAAAHIVKGHSYIDIQKGNSRIEKLTDQSFVHTMQEQASIKEMEQSSTVESMVDCTSVETLRGHSRIYRMADKASVGSMYHPAVIYTMRGESAVNDTECFSHILSAPEKIKVTSSCQMEPAMPFD